jgi:hypothetical protein
MGCCCSSDKDKPTFSLKDCMKDINIKSSCMSSCCVKGDSKIDNKHHHHHKKKHHREETKNEDT